MKTARWMTVLAVCIAVMLGGCAKKAEETGFLSDYSKLEPVSDNLMRYISPQVGQYSKFIAAPVTVKFYDEETAQKVTPEDISHLEQFFYSELLKAKPDRYEIVTEPGPGVAKLRIALTNLEKSTPALNVLPQTKLAGVGLGQVAAELELVDSMTGIQLAAAVGSDTGSRFSFSGLSKWGDAEAVMKDWAKKMWQRVDEAHGIKPE